MNDNEDIDLALYDRTGALLMLNKEERKLLRELLSMTLKSKNARDWIEKKLGKDYVSVGEKLLKTMGG
ncbi:MAG: hypothetical protein JW882_18910 [Deltaproteobacteria bacterium]|nr:hypothetical protein [Deltaproteobacteria bacterium]